MKRLVCALLGLTLCIGVLAACGPGGVSGEGGSSGGAGSGSVPDGSGGSEGGAVVVCRVIDEEDGMLLLAKQDGGSGDVYRLNAAGVPVTLEGESSAADEIESGMLVEVCYGGDIMESFPAQLGSVTSINARLDGFDDMAELYLEVLEDLWEVDGGLNENITELGVDLSGTRLSAAEQSAVAWAFGEDHGLAPIQGTYEELLEQGYITGEPLEGSDAKFYQWADGCLFSIQEKEDTAAFNLPAAKEGEDPSLKDYHVSDTVTFDAQKWRSGTGAYFFSDCTSVRGNSGEWSDYQVGNEAIS